MRNQNFPIPISKKLTGEVFGGYPRGDTLCVFIAWLPSYSQINPEAFQYGPFIEGCHMRRRRKRKELCSG